MNDRFFTLESNITKSDYKKLLYFIKAMTKQKH